MENTKKKERYEVIDHIRLNNTKRYVESRIDNTTINIDRKLKELFYNFCESYGMSAYKTLNITLYSFMYDEEFEPIRKSFFDNNFQKEQSLIKTLLKNKETKLTRRKRGEVISKSKITVPKVIYLDFCKICRIRRQRPSIAICNALEDYITQKQWEI